ncbi:MAG TPA: M1 family metallopeptidase, partial [Cyclobacteriaceae bacterium]|nr:M1 family metallopeptidase [Cyclobacteriaceae bacterium]
VDPFAKTLAGEGEITYYNNSPDTLGSVTFFLYHDLYAKRSARDDDINPALLTDGVVIEEIRIDDGAVDMENKSVARRTGTRLILYLGKPLDPDSSAKFFFRWRFTIPGDGFERSGAYDSTSMFIAYWYPEVAVYDDIDGWDRTDYTGGVEFYHDYSDFRIRIEVPENFLVWASAAPSNPEEVYPDLIMKKLIEVNENKATSIVNEDDLRQGIRTGGIWKYEARNFPDFSFALSDHYLWDARLFKSDTRYFLNTVYPVYQKGFSVVSQASYEALGVFTGSMPAFPFPFKYFTAFNGLHGGGMEFAGMINDTFSDSARMQSTRTNLELNRGLTYHEMFHQYFPFYMGINEKKYAWMDEGWATFTNFLHRGSSRRMDLSSSARLSSPPIMVPSNITPRNFYLNSYTLAACSYYMLQQHLGDRTFVECLQEYINRWKQKHPTPYDFFNTFSNVSGQNLDWFWKSWYFDWGYMDLGINSISGSTVEIQNYGGKPVAANVILTYKDGSPGELSIQPSVWKEDHKYFLSIPGKKKPVKAEIFVPRWGDAVKENDILYLEVSKK